MLVGAFLPIFQSDIRKFLASSSVGHIGLLLAALIPSTPGASEAATSYAAYYVISSGCFIIGIMKVRAQDFYQLRGAMKYSPMAGWIVLLSMFAMAGMPPFGNFLAKLDIFKLLANSQNYVLLSVASVHSVLSVVYIIKWGRFLFHEKSPLHKIN
jgi:NADH-quinone oxidoreductase subunit N